MKDSELKEGVIQMEFFDSHAHYNDSKFNNDREEILNRVYESSITKVVVAGYNEESSKQAIELAQSHKFIYATCGISPNDLGGSIEVIEELAQNEKVVAIGEIGLDYYWNKENKEEQKETFIKQIELANKLDKPIVIHSRDAVQDTISVLKNEAVSKKKGIFHCVQLNSELIKQGLSLGYYMSFAGPVTFKNSKNADLVIDMVPLDRILIETDSPYLSPDPLRGTRNNSENVKYVAKKISEVKKISLEEVAKITYENAMRIFEIDSK